MRLPRLIGQSVALDLVLTGRPVDAAEAKQIGLANRLVPAGEALNTAQRLAAELAKLPQVALRGDRRSVHGQHGRSIADAMAAEFEYGMAALAGQAQEGAARFRAGAGRHGGNIA